MKLLFDHAQDQHARILADPGAAEQVSPRAARGAGPRVAVRSAAGLDEPPEVIGMMLRKFSRDLLDSEPHGVWFRDLYPWDVIDPTPFGSSLAIVEPGGRTMLHSHDPAETFIICRGAGTMSVNGETEPVGAGDAIYLPPGCVHDLRNDSASEELVFVSVFWKARAAASGPSAPRLIIPSPPTPNGPLHLGHLAGPYLLADVMRRYHRARGVDAQLVLLTDDHQSYVADRAAAQGEAPAELAARFGDEIARAIAAFHADPDARISSSRDAAYRDAVAARFARLVAGGKLEARDAEIPYCTRCELALYDSYIAGGCPRCGARSYGSLCETCSAAFDSADLIEPRCDRCGEPPVARTMRRLVFPLRPYAGALADYHRRLRLGPKLRRLAAEWMERDLADAADAVLIASQPGSWGIPVEGLDGQVISPWFEVALAGSYLRDRLAPGAEVSCYFGYDNAYLYLIQDPAVSLALDPAAALPGELAANEFLMLDDAKMSTSRSRAVDANAVLSRVPADLVRLYLAKIRPEDARTSASLPIAQMFLLTVTRLWEGWLARLGAAIASEAGGVAPAYGNPSLAPWSHEQQEFLRQLEGVVARGARGYEACSLREASAAIHDLVERATGFGAAQGHLAGLPALAVQRATGLALELAAARTLARLVAPIMPGFAEQLWRCLGEDGAVAWSDDVAPIPAGQPIALAGRAFFPAAIDFGIEPVRAAGA
jgi:methionyl-tRNA synthetase